MHPARPFLAVLVVTAAVMAGGRTHAAGLETLLMPGKVVAGHAEFEQDCTQCHDRADRGRQPTLCMDCHEDVGADVRGQRGFHGRLPAIDRAQCKACHSEHLGRDADIVKLSRPAFDHARTDFALTGAHAASACDACHKPGRKYREAPSACVDCHRAAEPHAGKLGTDCAGCHETATWSQARFDHGKTRFALRERHAEVTCSACHGGNRYAGTPTQCSSCHAPDDVHRGGRGPDCGSCHGIAGWKTTRFDHARETGYALTGAHAPLDCKTCHTTANLTDPLPRDCAGCHRKADSHATRFGEACDKCHGTSAWQPATFDHVRDGHYELLGRHAKLDCHACHTGVVAQQKLGTECYACHRNQDAHSGQLGRDVPELPRRRAMAFRRRLRPRAGGLPAGWTARRRAVPRMSRDPVLQGRGAGLSRLPPARGRAQGRARQGLRELPLPERMGLVGIRPRQGDRIRAVGRARASHVRRLPHATRGGGEAVRRLCVLPCAGRRPPRAVRPPVPALPRRGHVQGRKDAVRTMP